VTENRKNTLETCFFQTGGSFSRLFLCEASHVYSGTVPFKFIPTHHSWSPSHLIRCYIKSLQLKQCLYITKEWKNNLYWLVSNLALCVERYTLEKIDWLIDWLTDVTMVFNHMLWNVRLIVNDKFERIWKKKFVAYFKDMITSWCRSDMWLRKEDSWRDKINVEVR